MYRVNDLTIRDLLSLSVRDPAATEIMARFPTIRELSEATPEELTRVKGLGQVKAKKLMAALELGKRLYSAPVNSSSPINSPQDVFNLLADMQLLDREHFKAINLNTKNHILALLFT